METEQKSAEAQQPTEAQLAIESLKRANARAREKTQKPFLDAIEKAGLDGKAELAAANAKYDALLKEHEILKAKLAAANAQIEELIQGSSNDKQSSKPKK